MIVGFVLWSAVAAGLFFLGLKMRTSSTAAGFWANAEPPKVRDTAAYNRAVARLWFVFSALFELLGIPLLFLKQNTPLIFLVIAGVVVLVIGLMAAYSRIENRFSGK